MARSQAPVHLWKRALARVGERPEIEGETESEIQDSGKQGEFCVMHWDDLVKQALEDGGFAWPFATRQEVIAAVSGVTFEGFDYVYALPSDCVTPLALIVEDERRDLRLPDDRLQYSIVSSADFSAKYLCTDLEVAEDFETLEYVALHDYIPNWPANFVEGMVYSLAGELALGLKFDTQLAIAMKQLADQYFRRARADQLNAQQPGPDLDPPSIQARE